MGYVEENGIWFLVFWYLVPPEDKKTPLGRPDNNNTGGNRGDLVIGKAKAHLPETLRRGGKPKSAHRLFYTVRHLSQSTRSWESGPSDNLYSRGSV